MTKTDVAQTAEPESGTTPEGLPWKIVRPFGRRFKIRALSVTEDDNSYDAAVNEDKTFNSRLYGRLQLSMSIMEPVTSLDDIGKWPVGLLVEMLDLGRSINALPAADDKGND